MSTSNRIILVLLVGTWGHFIDGWTNPSYSGTIGWWLWHAVNWLRRDVVIVVLLWPIVMHGIEEQKDKVLAWICIGLINLIYHHILYNLAFSLRWLIE